MNDLYAKLDWWTEEWIMSVEDPIKQDAMVVLLREIMAEFDNREPEDL